MTIFNHLFFIRTERRYFRRLDRHHHFPVQHPLRRRYQVCIRQMRCDCYNPSCGCHKRPIQPRYEGRPECNVLLRACLDYVTQPCEACQICTVRYNVTWFPHMVQTGRNSCTVHNTGEGNYCTVVMFFILGPLSVPQLTGFLSQSVSAPLGKVLKLCCPKGYAVQLNPYPRSSFGNVPQNPGEPFPSDGLLCERKPLNLGKTYKTRTQI